MHDPLHTYRAQLDDIDQRLIEALAARQEVVTQVAALKATRGQPVYDHRREREMLTRLRHTAAEAGLNPHFVASLFQTILDHSVRYQHDCIAGQRAA